MKSKLLKLGLVLSSLAFSFLICEALIRALRPAPLIVRILEHKRPSGGTEAKVDSSLESWLEPPALYRNTKTGLRFNPNLKALIINHPLHHGSVLIETNSLGFRGPEPKALPQAGDAEAPTRVEFLGDSITAADYLPESETFVRLFEQQMNSSGQKVEALNLGVGSLGLKDYLSIFRETGAALKPKIVVLGLYLNDYQRSGVARVPAPPRLLEWSWLTAYGMRLWARLVDGAGAPPVLDIPAADFVNWRADAEENFAKRELNAPLESQFKAEVFSKFSDWGAAWSAEMWQYMNFTLQQLASDASVNGAKLVVLLFPVRQQVESQKLFDYPERAAELMSRNLNLEFIDPLPSLRAAWLQNPKLPLFYDHCHHTAAGQIVVANHLQRELTRVLKQVGSKAARNRESQNATSAQREKESSN